MRPHQLRVAQQRAQLARRRAPGRDAAARPDRPRRRRRPCPSALRRTSQPSRSPSEQPAPRRAASSTPIAVICCVPLSSARPSFGLERQRRQAALRRSASAPSHDLAVDLGPAAADQRQRPDAPAAPGHRTRRLTPAAGTTGWMPSAQEIEQPLDDRPGGSRCGPGPGRSRAAAASRAPFRVECGAPTPTAWLTIRLRCSCRTSSAGMRRDAEVAEAGRDPVHDLVRRDEFLDHLAAREHPSREPHLPDVTSDFAASDRPDVFERQRQHAPSSINVESAPGHRQLTPRLCAMSLTARAAGRCRGCPSAAPSGLPNPEESGGGNRPWARQLPPPEARG